MWLVRSNNNRPGFFSSEVDAHKEAHERWHNGDSSIEIEFFQMSKRDILKYIKHKSENMRKLILNG